MAFVSKKTTPNGDVPDYMNDLDERVKTEFLLRKDYVIDSGANPNGRWEKWNSGKLVCRGVFTATNGTTQAQGGIFRSEYTQSQSFAMIFISAPEVELQTQHFSAMDAMINAIAYDNFSFRLLHYGNQTVDTPVLYIAEGKWK